MDFNFLTYGEVSEPFSTNNQKLSFSNCDFYIYRESFERNYNKYEDFDERLKKLDKQVPFFTNTIENSKEMKLFEDENKKAEKEEKVIIDKKYIESIQMKVKENILAKRPFKEQKNLGRKKKAYEGLGEHNKFSSDNIIRKVKHVILQRILNFINHKIRILYAYEGENILKEKKLFKLKQNQPISSRSDYNKNFLEKTLGEIFSEDISSKYSCHPSTHNKKLIVSLINDKDEKKRNIFNNIFNLTFIDCLKHFRGNNKIEELEGINNLEDYLKGQKNKNDEEYCILLKYFVNNYETIIKEKKSRIRVKNKLIQKKLGNY